MLKLAEMGVIPAEEILRQFEFPNVEELSQKARDQRMEKGQMDLAIAGHAQGGEQPQGNQGSPNQNMQELADKENMQMMQGNQLPPTEGSDLTHTQTHIDFTNTDMYKSASEEIKQNFVSHIQGEMQLHGVQ
jgi:hypothetical protein